MNGIVKRVSVIICSFTVSIVVALGRVETAGYEVEIMVSEEEGEKRMITTCPGGCLRWVSRECFG